MRLAFEQPTYTVTETNGNQILTVCVEVVDGVITNRVEAVVVSFQFTGEAMSKE